MEFSSVLLMVLTCDIGLKKIQLNQCRLIPKWTTLVSQFFLVNQIH